MNKDDLMKYALMAGGAFAVYWYITNHGPLGAVFAADGVTKIAASYWDTWFGTATTTPAVVPLPVTYPTALTPVATPPGVPAPAPVTTPVAPAPLNLAQLTTAVLQASGVNSNSTLNADQWNYYRNLAQPPALTPAQFGTLLANLPAGTTRDALTVDQFMNALYTSGVVPGLSGLGMHVPVQSRPSVPMMSFGGGFNAFPQKKNWSN